jgi:hypothetical protein
MVNEMTLQSSSEDNTNSIFSWKLMRFHQWRYKKGIVNFGLNRHHITPLLTAITSHHM